MWIEWLVCVPLMAFVSILVTQYQVPTFRYIKLIISMGLCIFFGFVTTFNMPFAWSVVCLILSCFSYAYAFFLAFFDSDKTKVSSLDFLTLPTSDIEGHMAHSINEMPSHRLTQYLLFVTPLFPAFYIIGIAKVVDNNFMFAGLIVANVAAKFLFTSR